MKCVVSAWGELKCVFEVLALDELCSEGIWVIGKCFQGIGAVEKGV